MRLHCLVSRLWFSGRISTQTVNGNLQSRENSGSQPEMLPGALGDPCGVVPEVWSYVNLALGMVPVGAYPLRIRCMGQEFH